MKVPNSDHRITVPSASRSTTAAARPTLRRATVLAVATSTLAATLVMAATTPPPADAQAACTQAVPVDDITRGLTGTGLTVSSGTTPDQFGAEVVGVLHNGIATGVDLVIAELDGPAVTANGVWAGMSGSPVVDDQGRLIGAVAYSLSASPSPIAGLVPAETMLELYQYPGSMRMVAPAESIDVPTKLLADSSAVRAAASASADQSRAVDSGASVGLRQLALPMSVSGLRSSRLAGFAERLGLDDRTAVTAGSSAPAAPAVGAVEEMVPGSNFAATLSWGDLTAAGIGTTTDVCDGQVLAFGHPFFFTGSTTMGVHNADALLIQPDALFGSYKLANVTDQVGTLDQDRLAGIRGTLGTLPDPVEFTSTALALDLGRSSVSTTMIADDEWVPQIAPEALLGHLDAVADRIGGGRVNYEATMSGTTSAGTPWRVQRENLVANQFDASFLTLIDVDEMLQVLAATPGDVSFDRIVVDSTTRESFQARRITGMRISVNGGGRRRIEVIGRLVVRPGDELVVDVETEAIVGGPAPHTVRQTMIVPRRLAGQRMALRGWGGRTLLNRSWLRPGPTIEETVAAINARPASNDVVVQFQRRDPETWELESLFARSRTTGLSTTGSAGLPVTVRRR